jgi:taurine dioxygenase
MEIRPLASALGAEIRGADLRRDLEPGTFEKIRAAWVERGLLLLRGQALDEDSLVAFARRFGELELPPASERHARGEGGARRPEIWIISNVIENGRPIGSLGSSEAEWHSDMSYLETPPTASLLYAREIPAEGGNTCFASMAAACDALPPEIATRSAELRLEHDSAYTSAGELRQGARPVDDPARAPGAVHPLICRHPESGRSVLFLGRRRNAVLLGLPAPESERLLDRLFAFATGPDFVYEHRWRVGDLLVWDNRQVLHRRDAFDPSARRIMLRAQVRGGPVHPAHVRAASGPAIGRG